MVGVVDNCGGQRQSATTNEWSDNSGGSTGCTATLWSSWVISRSSMCRRRRDIYTRPRDVDVLVTRRSTRNQLWTWRIVVPRLDQRSEIINKINKNQASSRWSITGLRWFVADRSRIKQTEPYIVVTTAMWNCFSSRHASVAVAMIQLTTVFTFDRPRRFDLAIFVAVLVCRRFDHIPYAICWGPSSYKFEAVLNGVSP